MSREAASAFLARLELDERLRGDVLGTPTAEAGKLRLSTETMAAQAARTGYSFSAQELYEACVARAASTELGDTDLDAVTGGSKNEVSIETLELVHEGFADGSAKPQVTTVCLPPGGTKPTRC